MIPRHLDDAEMRHPLCPAIILGEAIAIVAEPRAVAEDIMDREGRAVERDGAPIVAELDLLERADEGVADEAISRPLLELLLVDPLRALEPLALPLDAPLEAMREVKRAVAAQILEEHLGAIDAPDGD